MFERKCPNTKNIFINTHTYNFIPSIPIILFKKNFSSSFPFSCLFLFHSHFSFLVVHFRHSQFFFFFLDIYRIMLSDKKYGLSVNIMATRVMPSLLPQTVNPSLNLEQFTILLETLQEMLDHIDRQQRNKLKLDNLSIPSPERHRPLRHQFSSDNMHVPPFNIPNLRIDQRKTSSAEDMARKNSTGTVFNSYTKYIYTYR